MNFFYLAAITLNIFGWFLYLRCGPCGNPLSWFLSLVVSANAVVIGYLGSADITHVALYLAGMIPCSIAFMCSLKNNCLIKSKHDSAKILVALVLLLAIICTNSAAHGAVLLSFYYLLTYSILIASILDKSASEKKTPWLVWAVSALLQIATVINDPWYVLLIPVTNLFCWMLVFFAIIFCKKFTVIRAPYFLSHFKKTAGSRI
jgi:hypothetical protein